VTLVDAPVEMDWGPDGITYTTVRGTVDRLARRHIEQADLRRRVQAAVRPVVPVKQLERISGVSHQTIYAFLESRVTLQPKTVRALAAALERALSEVSA
jgi:hypothetical protein